MAVSDETILAMQRRLAKEGIWVEPASAAGVAGLAAQIQSGEFQAAGFRIVAICTGHGLKDPDIIVKQFHAPVVLPPQLQALEDVILA